MSHLDPPLLTRRALLSGVAAGLVVAACGGGSDGDSSDATTPTVDGDSSDAATPTGSDGETAEDDTPLLVAGFADGLRTPPALVAGMPQRAPVFLLDPRGFPLFDGAPEELSFDLSIGDEQVTGLVVPRHGTGTESAYYPIPFESAAPTTITVDTELDGAGLTVDFAIGDRSEVPGVFVGDAMRPVDSPTFDDLKGIAELCTRRPEACPFHDITLTDALAEGRPVALLIATPAFCQTTICGPVVDLLVQAAPEHPDIRFLHAEVWDDPASLGTGELDVSAVVEAYELAFEPSLIVAGADGVITTKLDFSFDRDELDEALATV